VLVLSGLTLRVASFVNRPRGPMAIAPKLRTGAVVARVAEQLLGAIDATCQP
jgi:hypothetical protein